MPKHDNEEELLRSVAIQNANSILLARQRAEQELIDAKEALETRTRELAKSLSMMRATLESTTDGIIVSDDQGGLTHFNEKFAQMWQVRGQHDCLPDAGVNRDGRADLAQFDTEAANLHLFVGATDEFDIAVGVATCQVAGTVQPGAGRESRVELEASERPEQSPRARARCPHSGARR